MRLTRSPEEDELARSVGRYLQSASPSSRIREVVDGERGYDEGVWRGLCQQQGIPSLAVSEQNGGAGFGLSALVVAMEECGAALVPGPLLGSGVISALILDAVDAADALAPVLDGSRIAAYAGGPGLSVSGGKIGGTAERVLDVLVADSLLAAVGDGVYLIETGQPGVRRTALETIDPTRRCGAVQLDGVPAVRLGDAAGIGPALDRALVALCAEQLGVMRRAMELAVDYAKTRVQFGRPIGSFQAVKHGLADLYATTELAASLVAHAGWVADNEPEHLPQAAALAAAYVLPQAFGVADQALHFHGGIGFTWEHDAHLYYKRAKTNQTLLSDPAEIGERIAAHLLSQNLGKIADPASV